MDAGSFDRLTRFLAGRLSRRVGLGGALAALVAGGVGTAPDLAARRRRGKERGPERAAEDREREVDAEKRPCGPTAKDNRCNTNKDCCTNFCRKPSGSQKVGRCRCIKPGKKCKPAQKCCGGAVCRKKRCTLAATCAATGGACTADANCCTGLVCNSGVCGPCVATVCADCAFTTVEAAYAAATAGSTIYIGEGTYPTSIIITKDMTFTGCPGGAGVVLEPSRAFKDSGDTYYMVMTEDKVDTSTTHTVTLRNLTLQGSATGIANSDEALLSSYKYGLISWVLDGCTMTKANYGISSSQGQHSLTNTTCRDIESTAVYQRYSQDSYGDTAPMSLAINGCTFDDAGDLKFIFFSPKNSGAATAAVTVTNSVFSNNPNGAAIEFQGHTTKRSARTISITGSTFSGIVAESVVLAEGATVQVDGCEFTGNGGTPILVRDGDLTVKDTQIRSNQSGGDGGGIYVEAYEGNVTLAVTGTTSITQNSAGTGSNGGGIYVYRSTGRTTTVTGANSTNVTSNTPDQCYLHDDGNPANSGVKPCNAW